MSRAALGLFVAAALCLAGAVPAAQATTPSVLGGSNAPVLDPRNNGTWAATLTITFNTPMEVQTSEADALSKIVLKKNNNSTNPLTTPTGAALEFSGNTVKVYYDPRGKDDIRLLTSALSSLYIASTALQSADDQTALPQYGSLGESGPTLNWDPSADHEKPNVARATLDSKNRVLSVVADEMLAYGSYVTQGGGQYDFGSGFADLTKNGVTTNNATKFHLRSGSTLPAVPFDQLTGGITMDKTVNTPSTHGQPSAHSTPRWEIRFDLTSDQTDTVVGYTNPYLHVAANAFEGIGSSYTVEARKDANDAIAKQLNILPRPDTASVLTSTRVLTVAFTENVALGTGSFYIRNSDAGAYDLSTDVSGTLAISGTVGTSTLTAGGLTRVQGMATPHLHLGAGAVTDSGAVANVAEAIDLTVRTPAPVLSSSKIDRGTGAVTLTFDRAVTKGTGNVDIRDGRGAAHDASTDVRVAASASSVSASGSDLTFTLSAGALTRVNAMASPHVYLAASVVADSSSNANLALTSGLDVVLSPRLVSAELSPTTRILSATFSEQAAAPASSPGRVYVGPAGDANGFTSGTDVQLALTGTAAVHSATITAAELARVLAMTTPTMYAEANAATVSGLSNSAHSRSLSIPPPAVSSARLHEGTGAVTITFSYDVSAGAGNIDILKGFNAVYNPAAHVRVAVSDTAVSGNQMTFTLSETERHKVIVGGLEHVRVPAGAVSAGAGGDNLLSTTLATTLSDTIRPRLSSAALDANSRVLTLTFSEHVRADDGNVRQDLIFIRNGSGTSGGTSLGTMTVTSGGASQHVTIRLTAALQQALTGYSTPHVYVQSLTGGHDAVRDMNQNRIVPSAQPVTIYTSGSPALSSASVHAGTGAWSVAFSETVSAGTATGTVLYVRDAGGGAYDSATDVALSVPSTSATASGTLSEPDRQKVIAMATPTVYAVQNAVKDTSNNGNAAGSAAAAFTADTTAPTLSSAALAEGAGILTLAFDETVKAGGANVDPSKIFINDGAFTTGGTALTGAAVSPSSGTTVIITLTETQRQEAIGHTTPHLRFDAAAVKDTSDNNIALSAASAEIADTADTTAPTLSSAALAEGTGILTLTFDETVKAGGANVDPSKIFINDGAFTAGGTALTGAAVSSSSNPAAVIITLTETQRQAAIGYGTPHLRFDAGAVKDTSDQNIAASAASTEIADTADATAPALSSASFNAGTGILTLTFDETVKAGSAAKGDIRIKDGPNRPPGGGIELSAATLVSTGDSAAVTLELAEDDRQAVIAYSDPHVYHLAGAVRDTSNRPAAANTSGTDIAVTADSVAPTIASAEATALDQITVAFSERIVSTGPGAGGWSVSGGDAGSRTVTSRSATPSGGSETLVLTLSSDLPDTAPDGVLLAYDASAGSVEDTSQVDLAAASGIAVADGIAPAASAEYVSRGSVALAFSEPVRLASGSSPAGWSVSGADAGAATGASAIAPLTASVSSSSATLTLDGSLADKTLLDFTLAYSAGNIEDASGNALAAYSATPDDGIAPLIASAESRTLNTITVTFSEPVDATSTPAAWVLGGANLPTGVAVSASPAISTGSTTLTLSGNLNDPVGDVTLRYAPGDIEDKSGNAMISQQTGVTQNLAPVITSARATAPGSITVTFSEPVTGTATSPSSTWRLLGTDASARVGAYAGVSQSATLVLGLSPPLPDTAPDVRLQYVRGPGDIADSTSEPLESTAPPHVTVSDGIPPALSSASLDEGTGVLTLVFGEAVDVSAMTESGMSIREPGASAGGVALSAGARTTASDSATVSFTLPESDRQSVIAMSSPQLDIGAGAVRDLSSNPIPADNDNGISLTPDAVPPVLQSAVFDEGAGTLALRFNERMAAPTAAQAARVSIAAAGATVAFAESDVASARLDGAATTVTVAVSEAKRQEVIAADVQTVDVLPGGLRDVSGAQASSSGTALSTVPDTARPSLDMAVLDIDNGLLVLSFSETMDAGSFAGELSKVSVRTPSGQVALGGTARADGARTVVTPDAQVLASLLAAVSAAPNAGAAGLLALVVPGAAPQFADTSGNAVTAASVPRDVLIEDGSPPSLVSASVTSSRTVVLAFSEDLDDGTVHLSDFAVPGYRVSSASERSGVVTLTLPSAAFSARDAPRVELSGPVSDLFGNVLQPGSAAQSTNAISPVEVSRFEVRHDGPAMQGDVISIEFRSENVSDERAVLRVNGQPVTTAPVPGGFDASYAVPPGAEQGPLELYVLAVSETGTPTEFSERDLTGPNAVIDTVPPSVESASISGIDSVTIVYDEPVEASASDYTGIRADGAAAVPASSAIGSGGRSVLVSWAGAGTVPSSVALTSGAVADIAGNAAAPSAVEAGAPRSSVTLAGPALALALGSVVQEITAPPGTEPVIGLSSLTDADVGARAAAAGGGAAVFESGLRIVTQTPGLPDVTFPAGTRAGGLGPLESGAVAFAEGMVIEASSSTAHLDEDLREQFPLLFEGYTVSVQVGDPNRDIIFDRPVLLEFDVPLRDALVFSAGTAGVPAPIPPCDPDWDPSSLPVGQAVPEDWPPVYDTEACVDAGSDSVWTGHFTVFGVSRDASGGGGSECDDCTPPTLGYDSYGARLVDGGFAYNGLASDVEHFFTPYPLIESEVGRENTASLKIYENGGPGNVSHVSLAFGLRSGEVISESRAVINYDVSLDGTGAVSVIDPDGAIDLDTLAASHEAVSCSADSELECLSVSITHSFRAPLEFDIVGTDVWDRERNSWQNYFNHGVRISGEPMDPAPGVAVNGGSLVLHPIAPGSNNVEVMADERGALYRLSPQGAYEPLRNISSLFHDIDESMYRPGGVPMQGYDRADPEFESLVDEQLALARAVLEQMNLGRQGWQFDAAEPPVREAIDRLELLQAVMQAERERAAQTFLDRYGPTDRPG